MSRAEHGSWCCKATLGLSEPEGEELGWLREENMELRTDREIPRKAAAYCAQETTR